MNSVRCQVTGMCSSFIWAAANVGGLKDWGYVLRID